GVTRAAERGELGFERAHLRAENELAVAEHAGDRVVNGASEPAPLRGNVDERDRRGIGAGALILDGVFGRGGASGQPPGAEGEGRAISGVASPPSPVTAGSLPLRIAPTKACSSARNGSAWPTERWRME